ncbi:MAG: alpha/beta hydrolase [Phycisphaerae bacterium]|nr:alpha/beta hydrolase [Phycisphaerae bacterium]
MFAIGGCAPAPTPASASHANAASGAETVGAATETATRAAAPAPDAAALVITGGETFTIESRVLGETRRINVLVPTVYGQKIDEAMPVLYMPDGGMDEDFLHIAGLVQVLVNNAGIRPHIVVGIENTQRRRDLTGPTEIEEDKKIAPVVGGSASFRRFLREELMPQVRARYRTTGEAAIMGESLAGLFVVECFMREPELFSSCIAIDPSLWWNGEGLVKEAAARRWRDVDVRGQERTLSIVCSGEPTIAEPAARMARAMSGSGGVAFEFAQMPEESHATIYHPAAIRALRKALAPPASR